MNEGQQRYKELWCSKLKMSGAIRDIAVKLSETPENIEPEEILLHIEARQKIIAEIDRLDLNINALEKNLPELSKAMTMEKQQYLEQLESIKLIDQVNEVKLQNRLLFFKEKLEKIYSGKKILAAYKQGISKKKQESLFVDSKG